MSDTSEERKAMQGELAEFLRKMQPQIIHEWEEATLALPRARELDRPTLIDFIPPLLDDIADMLDDLHANRIPDVPVESASKHARHRLEEGFDLDDVIVELSLLRDTILRMRELHPDEPMERGATRLLDQAIDRVMITSAKRFSDMRNRLLESLDRVSQAALHTSDFDEFLNQLVRAFRKETLSVDSAAIFIREEGLLRVHAAAGSAAPDLGITIPIGRGFAGTIAASGRALAVTCSDDEPLTGEDPTCGPGILGMFGLPLVESGEVIGVAQMASTNAPSFSAQDRALFGSMCSRAAAAIKQQGLRRDAQLRADELEASEKRFRSTFEAAALGIAHVSPQGDWLRLNQRYCEILGLSQEEALQTTFREVTHPADLPRDLETVARFKRGELQEASHEKRYFRSDGSIVWVQLMLSAVRDPDGELLYFIAAANDISEQKRLRDRITFLAEAGAALASSLEYHETLQRIAQLAVTSLADWCLVEVVESEGEFGEFFAVAHRDPSKVEQVEELRRRYPPDEDATVGPAHVLKTGQAEFIAEVEDRHLAAFAIDSQHRASLEALQLRSALFLPLETHGRVVGTISLLTERSRPALDEMDVATARELAARAAIAIENALLHQETKRAVRLRDRVLAIVAHDLRTPLATINLSSSVLSRSSGVLSNAQSSRAVEAIDRAVARSKRLIEDLLDMSSIQSGQLSLDFETYPAAPILIESFEQFLPIAHDAGIELERRFEIEHTEICCDRDRLLQVLSNIVGNAVKFCSDGDRVELRARTRDEQLIIEVADTGPGIAAEELGQVFDLYWRSDRREGSGLGLFISRGIVEAHGGSITVKSAPSEGSTFTIALPLEGPQT